MSQTWETMTKWEQMWVRLAGLSRLLGFVKAAGER